MSNLGMGALFLKVEADVQPALAQLAALRASAVRTGREVTKAIAQASGGTGGVRTAQPTISPKVDTGPLAQLRAQVDSLTGAVRNVRVVATADTGEAVTQLARLDAEIDALSGRVASVTVNANDAAAVADLTELQTRLAALEARRTQLRVELASTGAAASPAAELAQLTGQLDALRARTARVRITADAGGAETEIASIRAQLDQLGAGVRSVRLDVSDTALVTKVERAKTQIAQLEAELRRLEGGATTASRRVTVPKDVFAGVTKQAERAAADTESSFSKVFKALRGNANREIGGGLREATREVSGAFASLGAARSGNVFYAVSGVLNVATNSAIALTRAVTSTATGIAQVGAAAGPVGAVVGGVMAAGFAAASVAAAGLTYKLASLAAQATLIVGTLALVGKEGVSIGTQFEETAVAFRASLGSFGEQEIAYLKKISVESGKYDFLGLQSLDRTLLAYRVLDDEVRRGLLNSLITLGTVQGKSVDQLEFAANALGQVYQFGSAQGQELRQLVNSLGVSVVVLKNLPEYASKTTGELERMSSDGIIPATKFFQALQLEAAKYGDVVEQANQTVTGKLSRLKESFSINLGEAFFTQGVQGEIAGLIDRFIALFESIDFEPVAAGFRQLFEAINLGLGGIVGDGGNGSAVKTFFEQTLPKALENLSRAAYLATGLVSAMFGEFVNGANQTTGPLSSVIEGIGYFAYGVTTLVSTLEIAWAVTKGFTGEVVNLAQVLYDTARAYAAFTTFDYAGAVAAAGDVIANLGETGTSARKAIDDAERAGGKFQTRIAKIAVLIENAKRLKFKPFDGLDLPDRARPTSATPGGGAEDDAAKKAAERISKLRDQLFDLTERWNGFRSELDKGLFGDGAFTATADQIANLGKRIDDILTGIGQTGVAAAVRSQIRSLAALADERVALAEKIKDGEQALAEAVRTRDEFASRVRQQAFDFVNALRLEETEVDAFQRISGGGVAGYIVTRTKQFKSFLDQQRNRLSELRQFATRIGELSRRGLDSNLLQTLVAAGPEQSGEVVKQLAAGGDDAIAEVNSIQKELGQVAEKLGGETARKFYGAGVDQAQAWVDGLKSRQNQITMQAAGIAASVYAAVAPFAKQMEDVGTAAGTAIATGLGAGGKLGANLVGQSILESTQRIMRYVQVIQRIGPAIAAIERTASTLALTPVGQAAANAYRQNAYARLNAEVMSQGTLVMAGDTSVSVFIGGQKIDEIVRTEVTRNARGASTGAVARGRS